MKKIIAIAVSFAVLQMGFPQATALTAKNVSAGSNGAQHGNQISGGKTNAGYLNGKTLPGTKKSVATAGQTSARPVSATTNGLASQKAASGNHAQAANLSNEQRVSALNARLAENKAQEQTTRLNTHVPVTNPTGVPSTLKKPAVINKAAAASSNSVTPANNVNTIRQ